jgi:hypothetical protein
LKDKLIRSIFWALVAVFVISVCMIFIRPISRLYFGEDNPKLMGFIFFISAGVFLLCLGVTLLVLTIKRKTSGLRKNFLLLVGASAAALPVFVILHNLVSGLFGIEEAVFFILATLVCPIGFLVGAVSTIIIAAKNKSHIPV